MFSSITKNWRGRPLESHEVIVNLIGNTTTKTGLRIWASLDSPIYPTGIAVQDQEMAALNLEKAEFHGEWNYRICLGPIDHVISTRCLSGSLTEHIAIRIGGNQPLPVEEAN